MSPIPFLRTVAVCIAMASPLATSIVPSARSADRPEPPLMTIPERVVADTLQVRREKLTLREIIERSIEGERTKLAGRRSMTYTAQVRVVSTWKKKKEIEEVVLRTYAEADGFERTVELGQRTQRLRRDGDTWIADDPDDDEPGFVQVDSGESREFEQIPFFFEDLDRYRFELVDRIVEREHVIFRVAFEPRSEFDALPSGTLYIDTNRYRVVHEEFDFSRNPFPLLLRDITRVSRQWTELPGGEWVFTKIRGEVTLRADPFGMIPERVIFSVERDEFAFDVDYDAREFGAR